MIKCNIVFVVYLPRPKQTGRFLGFLLLFSPSIVSSVLLDFLKNLGDKLLVQAKDKGKVKDKVEVKVKVKVQV